jgi:general secretion pathway protein D
MNNFEHTMKKSSGIGVIPALREFGGSFNKLSAVSLACLAMTGCAVQSPRIPAAIDFERSAVSTSNTAANTGGTRDDVSNTKAEIRPTPIPPAPIEGNVRAGPVVKVADAAATQPGDITVTFEQMALPAFIQAVYGGVLQLNYSLEPAVASRTELITFRSPRALTAKQLFEASENLLKSYGVNVQDLGGVIRLSASANTTNVAPMIRRGRAQPTVPGTLRPIFHYVEPETVNATTLISLLRPVLGDRVTIQNSGTGLLVSGTSENVTTAMELIQVFDQPSLRSYQTRRVVPKFWGAEELSRRLSDVLRAEGYSVGNQAQSIEPIVIYSIPPVNSVMIFAASKEVVDHVLEWAADLDQLPNVQAGSSFFTYSVRNSDATQLAKALNDLIGPSSTSALAPGQSATLQSATRGRRIVANTATNSLIFQGGSQEDYREWLALLNELDRPVKSALIDVLVAEVALDEGSDLGFTWRLDQLGSGASAVRLRGTVYSTQISGAGVAINALLGGNPLRQLAISALARDSQSKIVSNPRIMTRNGESASINVGQEVPTVSSLAVTTNGTNNVLGNSTSTTTTPISVQYRSTGVLLRVRPVIHGSDRIDIEVSQEISSAEPTTTGVSSSPTIRKRSLETKLTVRDGATILLGGLISDSTTNSDSGVPVLKDVPGLGNLFKKQERSRGRTELVMLITPYIINDYQEADGATQAFSESLGDWAKDIRDRIKTRRDINDKRALSIVNTEVQQNAEQLLIKPDNTTSAPLITPKNSDTTNLAPRSLAQPPRSVQQPLIKQDSAIPAPTAIPKDGPASNTSARPSRGMINLGGGTPQAVGNEPSPSIAQKPAASISNPNAVSSTVPTSSGKPAPAMINGMKVPEGATIVDDPKLLEEIRRALGR